jgi:hypothetical protein
VLEPVQPATDPTCTREPEQVLRRLDEDRHLVAIVLPAVVQTVERRAHGGPQNRPALDELSALHRFLLSIVRGRRGARPTYSAPRANSETSWGVAVSKPTTSSMPGSFGSAIEKPFETIATTTSRAGIRDARR